MMTVCFNDGREPLTGSYSQFAWGEYCYLFESSYNGDYQYRNPWTIGGNNTAYMGFDGIEVEFNVSVIENPVANVTLTYNFIHTENSGGSWTTTIIDDRDVEYFHYNLDYDNIYVTVDFNDGRESVSGVYHLFNQDYNKPASLEGIDCELIDTQYTAPWTVGTDNELRVSIGGVEAICNVEVRPSAIGDVSAWYSYTLVENVSGNYSYNEENEPHFYYDLHEDYIMLYITFTDGREPVQDSVYNLKHEYPELIDNIEIDYNNTSHIENWSAGDNYFTVTVGGKTITAVANVIENPVVAVEMEYTQTISEDNYQWEQEYLPETGEAVLFKSYYCDFSNLIVTVTMKDGSVYKDYYYNMGKYLPYDVTTSIFSDQSYHNQWTAGEHYFNYRYAGFEGSFAVTITSNPIESLSVYYMGSNGNEGNTIVGTHGWSSSDRYYDGDKDSYYTSPWYFRYEVKEDLIMVTLSFKDGREAITASVPEIRNMLPEILGLGELTEEEKYNLVSIYNFQSYYNQWTVEGTDNTIEVEINRISATCNFNIAPSGIERIEVTPQRALISGDDTFNAWDNDLQTDYQCYDYLNTLDVTLYFNDGTTDSGSYYDICNRYRANIVTQDGQSAATPWESGVHAVDYTLFDHQGTFYIEVVGDLITSLEATYEGFLYEGISGYTETDYNTGNEYFRYSVFSSNIVVTATLYDGRTIAGTPYDIASQLREITGSYVPYSIIDSQSSDNSWGLGNHIVTIQIMGKTCEMVCTVVENNIASLDFEPVVLNTGRYTVFYDEEGNGTERYLYNLSTYDATVTVSYTNGQSETMNINDLYQKYGYYDYIPDPQYDNTEDWKAGNTYTFPVNILNTDSEFTVIIEECPEESIEFVENAEGIFVTVNYRDGSSVTSKILGYDFGEFITDNKNFSARINKRSNGYFFSVNTAKTEIFTSKIIDGLVKTGNYVSDLIFYDVMGHGNIYDCFDFKGEYTLETLDFIVYLTYGNATPEILGTPTYVNTTGNDYIDYEYVLYNVENFKAGIEALFGTEVDIEMLKETQFYDAETNCMKFYWQGGVGGFELSSGPAYYEKTSDGFKFYISIINVDYENGTEEFLFNYYVLFNEDGSVAYFSRDEIVDTHIHTVGDWETVVEATCTQNGKQVKKCTSCGEILDTKIVFKLAHNMVDGTCTVCGQTAILGDISGDGMINTTDLLLLKRVLIGAADMTDAVRAAGDINGDGNVNPTDLLMLKLKLIGG